MFTKKTYADIKKSTLKIQDCKKDSATRLKHLKTILDFVDTEGAKSLFETNYSHVYYILYDTFVQAETNLKQKAHKAHREELDGSLWLLGKILCLLPELLARRWQCHSLSRVMAKLLHLGNSPKLRKEGVRYFLLWYQALAENAPNYVHTMFADLIPGLIVPQKGISGPDGEFNSSDVFSHPNMKVEVGTSVFHDMFSHPVQTSEIFAILPPSSSEKSSPPDPKEGLEVLLNCMVQTSGCLKWRDNCQQKDIKSFAFLLNRFKEVFLPVFCPNFDVTNTIYEPRADLPIMRTVNKKDEVMSSCVVVLINWISRFVHEKLLNSKLENIHIQEDDHARSTSNPRFLAYLQGTIVRDVLYSTQKNVNFIHEVYRQAFLLGFTSKSQIDAMRTSIAVYRDWMTSNNPPPFMLEPDEGDSYSTSSIDTSSRSGQKLRTASYVGAISREVIGVQAGLQNVLQVFVTNAANVFLVNTSHLNIVFPSVNRDYRSTPLNEQTDICKKVLNVYRTMVMNTRMDPKTWEQLLLVLLQVTSIVLNQNSSGSRPALGTRLGQAIFQTLIVTWIRAHTNVPINVQLWERFLTVLTSLTYRDELINEWDKTMQTLTRVLGRYVYNLNLQDLPLDRLADTKGKRRRMASVWQSGFKDHGDARSSRTGNDKNGDSIDDQQRKEGESSGSSQLQLVSASNIVPFTPVLGRCHSEGSLSSARVSRKRVHDRNRRTIPQPSSFEHSLNAILDQNSGDLLISSEKLCSRANGLINQSNGGTLRRAISLSSFQLKNVNHRTKNGESDSLQGSRSPSPTASSGIEGGSIKDSPMQIDALVADTASFEDNGSVTSSERRSIILGGSVSGWIPDTAAIMWKRMLGSLGDVNQIQRPELHAQVFKHLVEMTCNLIKLKQNQGISEDNQSTPSPPNLVPPIGIASPWCYGAQLLSPDFKKGKLSSIQMLGMLAVHGSIHGMNHLSLLYNLFHKILTGEDRAMIYCLFKHLEGPRFLSLLLPGHTLLLLDIVHASAVLLTSLETSRTTPRAEVVALLGSLLSYPSTVIPKPVLQPSMQQIELMECPDLQDHILNIILRCARREPSSKARCVAFSQLGQWIYLELNRPTNLKNTFSQAIPQHLPRTGSREQALAFNPRIKEAIQVLLQALQFKHRTIAVVAAGSLKICSERGHELSKIERLPQLIITALCKALEVQHVPNPKDTDKMVLTTLMMCLGEFCMSFPVNFMLEPINNEGDSLIIMVLRVLFQILSGATQNIVKLLISDNDFDFNITTDDVLDGKFNCEANFQTSETIQRYNLAIQLCAKAVIMHLVTYMGHFPTGIGASRLSSLVEEQDDIWSSNLALIGGHEGRRDSADLTVPQVLQSQNIQLFMLNSGLMASFIELPALKLPGGGVTAGLVTADKQVRVLLRDLNGKSCWEASILYSEPKETRQNCGAQNYMQQNPNGGFLIKYQIRDISQPFYSLVSSETDAMTVHRHTMRHRPPTKLPLASDSAADLDQLDDLLQYIGHTSPECLTTSAAQLNSPGTSPLGCQLEAQTISILLNQRSIEQEYVANVHQQEREKTHSSISLLQQASEQSFESYNTTSLYKSEVPFQYCRLLFSHLGLAGWERRSRTHLLQRSEKLMRELRNVDIQKCRDTHKVAVIYVACGQEDKNSILKNTYGSSAYEMFVSALGWEIDLETHNGFLGGLPRQGCGATAPYYATPFVEVMYHAATRMPSDTPEALLTKTRHLGNDEIHIVWSEHYREYRRDILPTEFCDVLIVVYPLKNCLFRVTVNWKPDVPWFGPLANESVVNGSCLATLVRETAINASRSKRSSLSLYQQFYEERNRSLESVSMRYKENSTFEDFANRIYSPIPPASYASLRDSAMGTGSAPLAAALIDHHRATVKGWVQTTVDSTIRDLTQAILPDNPSPRAPRKLQPFKSSSKKTSLHQNNTPPESPTLPGRKLK